MSPRMGLDTETIIRTAVEMADANGLESVTLASLAKKLNVRSPSLYNHIDGLGELKQRLALYGLEQLYERLMRAVGNEKGEQALHLLAFAYVEFVRSHPGLYESTLRAPNTNEDEIQLASNKIVALAVDVLKVYRLSNDEVIHAVRGFRSILHGFATLEQKKGFGLPINVDVSLTFLINTYIRGIQSLNKGINDEA